MGDQNHYFSKRPKAPFRKFLVKFYFRGHEFKFVTSPGVFSFKKVDRGTKALLKYMYIENGWKVLDLGCGYGVIGIVVAKLYPKTLVCMVDVNQRACSLSRTNLKLNGVRNAIVLCGNMYEPVKGKKFNCIVTNPPISAGLSTCYEIVEKATEHLEEDGLLQVVAREKKGGRRIREKMLQVFGNCQVLGKSGGFWVYASRKL